MPTLGDLRSTFVGLVNRRDLTTNTALQNTFLKQGLARVQRILRVPSMERATYITAQATPTASFMIPDDLLEIMDVFAQGFPLEHVSFRQLMSHKARSGGNVVGTPKMYARVGASLFLWPILEALGEVVVTYYGEFSPLVDDTSSNEVTDAMPDLFTYAALTYAGDYFKMDQAQAWEARFEELAQETQDQAAQLNMNGGTMSIQSPHGDY